MNDVTWLYLVEFFKQEIIGHWADLSFWSWGKSQAEGLAMFLSIFNILKINRSNFYQNLVTFSNVYFMLKKWQGCEHGIYLNQFSSQKILL